MRTDNRIAASGATAALRSNEDVRPAHLDLLLREVTRRVRLAVIYGGDKNEPGAVIQPTFNPRSWKSYRNVAEDIAAAMRRLGCHRVEVLPDDMRLGQRLRDLDIHMAWLNTGGVQGHCAIAHAASMLEQLGVPYVGHTPLVAALLDNKLVFKRQLVAMGLPTARWVDWHPARSPADPTTDERFAEFLASCADGFIVKPVSGRASLHVQFVDDPAGLAAAVAAVFEATRDTVLIEAFLPGSEYCIAVSGPSTVRAGRLLQLDRPFTFAAVERLLNSDEQIFTSMDLRPITQERTRRLDPGHDALLLDGLCDIAETLYARLPLSALVRIDVRCDVSGRLHVLEVNPKPDLKAPSGASTSLVAAGLSDQGMSYDDLIYTLFANSILGMRAAADGSFERLIGRIERSPGTSQLMNGS